MCQMIVNLPVWSANIWIFLRKRRLHPENYQTVHVCCGVSRPHLQKRLEAWEDSSRCSERFSLWVFMEGRTMVVSWFGHSVTEETFLIPYTQSVLSVVFFFLPVLMLQKKTRLLEGWWITTMWAQTVWWGRLSLRESHTCVCSPQRTSLQGRRSHTATGPGRTRGTLRYDNSFQMKLLLLQFSFWSCHYLSFTLAFRLITWMNIDLYLFVCVFLLQFYGATLKKKKKHLFLCFLLFLQWVSVLDAFKWHHVRNTCI